MNNHTTLINLFLKHVKHPHYVISNNDLKSYFLKAIDNSSTELYWTSRNYWVERGVLAAGIGPGGSVGFSPYLTRCEIMSKINNILDELN
jgi:hypothetical protein